MIKEIFKWKPIVIGTVTIACLLFTGTLLPAFLVGGLLAGIIITGNTKNAAINGAILGLIGGLVYLLMFLVMYPAYLSYYIYTLAFYTAIGTVLSIIGGVLGFVTKSELMNQLEEPAAD